MSRIDRLICQVLPRAFLMALTAEGRLVELQVTRRDRPSLVDGVYLGRLERVMADLDAAFVDIGTGRSGFLRAEDRAGIDGWPPAGAPVLVQVRGESGGDLKGEGKGPRLSMNIAVSGRYLVYHPLGSGVSFSRRIDGESERERLADHVGKLLEGGIVLRTAAAGAPAAVLQGDASRVMERWEKMRRLALDTSPPADLSARIPGERDPIEMAHAGRQDGAARAQLGMEIGERQSSRTCDVAQRRPPPALAVSQFERRLDDPAFGIAGRGRPPRCGALGRGSTACRHDRSLAQAATAAKLRRRILIGPVRANAASQRRPRRGSARVGRAVPRYPRR